MRFAPGYPRLGAPRVLSRLGTGAKGVAGSAYDPAATAYFAAMSVQPSATNKQAISDAMVALRAAGHTQGWLSFPALLGAKADCYINALNPSQIGTPSGTGAGLGFTAGVGLIGNPAGNAKLDLGITDAAMPGFAQNSAALWFWCTTPPSVSGPIIGLSANANTRINLVTTGAVVTRIHNGSSTVSSGGPSTDLHGFSHGSRTADNLLTIVHDGDVDQTNTTAGTSAPTSDTFQVLCGNSVYSDAGVAVFGIGPASNAAAVRTAVYNALHAGGVV